MAFEESPLEVSRQNSTGHPQPPFAIRNPQSLRFSGHWTAPRRLSQVARELFWIGPDE